VSIDTDRQSIFRQQSSYKHKNNLFSVRLSKEAIQQITLRRRLQQLHRLFYGRYQNHTLPNDDSGWHDAYVYVNHLAGEPNAGRRILKFLELTAPWMTTAEAIHLTDMVLADPRSWNSEQIAAELNVAIVERDMYRLTTFGAVDMSREERHRRDNRRRLERRRRKARMKTRAEWLATQATTPTIARRKPWVAYGMSRATWYRLPKIMRQNENINKHQQAQRIA
jgi:hypothetical protein